MGYSIDIIDKFVPPIDEKTVIFVLKPDAVRRKLTQSVLNILFSAGFEELGYVTKILTPDEVKIIYKETFEEDYPLGVDDPRTNKHIEHMISGPSTALLLKHNTISKPSLYLFCRKLRGEDWIPVKCSPQSIRYLLRDTAYDNYDPEFTDGFIIGEIPHSIVHATLSDLELKHAYYVFFRNGTNRV